MKPYGQKRRESPGRTLRGTSRPCPCCVLNGSHRKDRSLKKRERQAAKRALSAD